MTDNIMHDKSYRHSVSPELEYSRPMLINQDEIDLKELFLTLWKSKLLISLSALFFGVIALVYAFTTPEVWTSNVKVMKPRINGYYQLSREVNRFQPVFNVQVNGADRNHTNVQDNNELTSLVQPKKLFRLYIDTFNSSIYKKAFLEKSEIYQQFLVANSISKAEQKFVLDEWSRKIKALPEDKRQGEPAYYTLSVSSFSQQSSYELLKQYSYYISELVRKEVVEGVNNTIASYKVDLLTRASILNQQAKQKLLLEKKRAEIAVDITSKASLDKPFLNYSNNDLFPINLGKKASVAKKEALDRITDLSLFEPELITINAKLDILAGDSQIKDDVKFDTINLVDEISTPLSRDKPKRSLIVILGLLFGMMISVVYLLVKKVF